jgi:hypothetical protein
MHFIDRVTRQKLRAYYSGGQYCAGDVVHHPLDATKYRHQLIISLLDMVEELIDQTAKDRLPESK